MDASSTVSTSPSADPAPIDVEEVQRRYYSLVTVHQQQGDTVTGGWLQNKFGPLTDVIRYANQVSSINSGIRIAILEDSPIGRYEFFRVSPIVICTSVEHRILRRDIRDEAPRSAKPSITTGNEA